MEMIAAENSSALLTYATANEIEELTARIAVGLDFGFAKEWRAAGHRGEG
jgi:hypothetical protein